MRSKRQPKQRSITAMKWLDPIYGVEHRVVVCGVEECRQYARDHFDTDLQMQAYLTGMAFCAENDDTGEFIVNYWFLKGFPLYTVEGQTLILHEVSHGVDFAFTHKSIPLGMEMTEPRAYYLGAVYGKVCKMLGKHLMPPRKRGKR